MAIDEQQIRIAIVIVIEKPQSPSAQQLGGGRNLARLIRECNVFLIVIKTEEFIVDISDEKILPTIAVIVSGVDTHSRTCSARLTKSDPGCQTNFLKLFAALVDKKKVRHRVVGHEEIQPTVVVDVSRNGAERLTRGTGNPGLGAYVAERAIAIVAKEMTRTRFV